MVETVATWLLLAERSETSAPMRDGPTLPAVDSSTYRRIMIGSLGALALLVVSIWVINPLGDDSALPAPVEDVFPLPGDTVVRQTVVEIDLPVGYAIELEIDGIRIPAREIGLIEGTGEWSWGPGPGHLWEVWEGGEHTVTVHWDVVGGPRRDPGSFTWVFRVI